MTVTVLITFGIFGFLVITLLLNLIRPVYAFSLSAFCLIVFNIITIDEFIQSFANTSLLTIFLLIFIAKVIRDNFNVIGWMDYLFKRTTNPRLFLFKKSLSVSLLSSVMNNTPIVAMLIPYSILWAKENKVGVSKLLLPISFAAITGGMITVIGTSTNLVLNGFLESNSLPVLGFTDYLIPGVLVSIGAAIYSSTLGYNLLPNRKLPNDVSENLIQDYLVECVLLQLKDGKENTVESLNLRDLKEIFLAEVIRQDQVISPVSPTTKLQQGDRLFFAGDKNSVISFVENSQILDWAKSYKFNIPKGNAIVEAVVPYNSILANNTLKNIDFRSKYDSAVIGIHRNGEQLKGKLGGIILKPGDLLIIIAGNDFKKRIKTQSDLYLIKGLIEKRNKSPKDKLNKTIFGLVFIGMILAHLFFSIPFFLMLLGILGISFFTGFTNSKKLKDEFNLELLMILGSAIAIGVAMTNIQAGKYILEGIQHFFPSPSLFAMLATITFFTVVLTNFITNVAAVSIMFPIVFSLAPNLSIPTSTLFLIVAFSASASFIAPMGYQTNIMVMGPGGYNSKDYFRFGFPMTIIYFAIFSSYLYLT
ncbi:MAG: SLC13 family permease [Salibacteraceae bacterium]